MRKISTMKNRFPKSLSRGRVAVVGGGVAAAIALGSTAAFASDAHTAAQPAATAAPAGVSAGVLQHPAAGSQAAAAHVFGPQGAHKPAAVGAVTVAAQKAVMGTAVSTAAQQKAAAEKAREVAAKAKLAAAHAKAAEQAAAKRAKAKAAASHKSVAASWETPTTGYVLGAGYAKAGPHWIHKHSGQDFVVNTGTTVRAAHTGTVVTAGWGGAYGNNIVIKHGSHLYTQYGHLSHIGVHVGEKVTTGEKIGLSGSTGNSTGPHLHFEVRTTPYYGSSVEPLHFLRAHGVHV